MKNGTYELQSMDGSIRNGKGILQNWGSSVALSCLTPASATAFLRQLHMDLRTSVVFVSANIFPMLLQQLGGGVLGPRFNKNGSHGNTLVTASLHVIACTSLPNNTMFISNPRTITVFCPILQKTKP